MDPRKAETVLERWSVRTLGYASRGRTDHGAPSLVGRWPRPPLWFCWLCIALGVACIAVQQWSWWATYVPRRSFSDQLFNPLRWAERFVFWFGLFELCTGWWLFRFRRQLRRLAPADELAAQFGTDAATLAHVAKQSQIQPAYRINGVDYYDRADFADASTLLRPAEEPKPALLRSAGSSQDEAAERLLRATNGTEEQW